MGSLKWLRKGSKAKKSSAVVHTPNGDVEIENPTDAQIKGATTVWESDRVELPHSDSESPKED